MKISEIINHLKERETAFSEVSTFSVNPGIYALFYRGDNFPVLKNRVRKHDIIYIGKTEESQERRDAKTHFASGKTGSSTVRKSIGALLRAAGEKLTPIPRNDTDYKNGRSSHFQFDTCGEEKITQWMCQHLALSFYECDPDKQLIDELETQLIDATVPILNISKNPKNTFKDELRRLRKECASTAAKGFVPMKEVSEFNPLPMNDLPVGNKTTGKYIELWENVLHTLTDKLQKSQTLHTIQMNRDDFVRVGNRKSYSFCLEYIDGNLITNTSGSAVARDLVRVLEQSREAKKILSKGYYKIRMGNTFCVEIIRKTPY